MCNSRVLSLRCQISHLHRGDNISTHSATAHCVRACPFVCVCVCISYDGDFLPCQAQACCLKSLMLYSFLFSDYIPRPFSSISAINNLVFHLSGPGGRTGPPGRVFQRRPVLHSRLSYLRGGVHIWRVCPEERGASQEEDSRQPLWSHYWTGPTG